MPDDKVMIHVLFAPDGSVTEIDECPADLTAQAWFDRLSGQRCRWLPDALRGARDLPLADQRSRNT